MSKIYKTRNTCRLCNSKNLELVEKRALFLDLSYNYALLAAGQGDGKHDLPSAMFSMYTQLTNYAITGKPMTPKAIQDSHTRFEATRTFNQKKTDWWNNYRLKDIEPNVRKIAEGIRNLRVNPDGSEMSWTKGLQFNYQAGLGQLFDIHESMLNELNKRVKQVRFSTSMGPEEKRIRMDKIYAIRHKLLDRIAESPALR
mgnify:CR=1 FL=1